jgi:hypothetical protein
VLCAACWALWGWGKAPHLLGGKQRCHPLRCDGEGSDDLGTIGAGTGERTQWKRKHSAAAERRGVAAAAAKEAAKATAGETAAAARGCCAGPGGCASERLGGLGRAFRVF